MPAVGVLTLQLRIEHSHSLKDKRSVVLSLKERLRNRHNVAVAEIEDQHLWQSAVLAAVTVSSSRQLAEKVLRAVESTAAREVGGMLVRADVEWLD